MLWMACHDPMPANSEAALLVWSSAGCELSPGCMQSLLSFLGQPSADVRAAAADALATSLQVSSTHSVSQMADLEMTCL